MFLGKKKLKQLAVAVTLGLMSTSIFSPMMSVYAEETEPATNNGNGQAAANGNKAANTAQTAAAVMGVTGGLPIIGSNASYTWVSFGPKEVPVYPVCTGTKAPTQNEKATYMCAVVGTKAYGAAIPISATVTGGEQTIMGVAPFTYQKEIETTDKTTGKKTKKKVQRYSAVSITITINGYQGQTTVGGGDLFDSFNSGVESWNGGSNSAQDSTQWGIDNTGDSSWDSDNGSSWGNSSCPDGTSFCSNNGESNTLFNEDSQNSSGDGYYDSNGMWHSGTNPYEGGYYDSNGVWHSTTNDNSSSSSSGGSGSGDGYYDSNGMWHSGTNPYEGGYYDSNGTWHSTTNDNSSNSGGSGDGYYDSNGVWHEGTNPYEGGYYDSNGTWHNTDGSTNGYYDENGIWQNGGSTGGATYDSGSSKNYGNLLDSLLNSGSGSYNSGDVDWGSSTGGDSGEDNLDDYLSGTDDTDSVDGLTDDLLGIDEDLLNADPNAANETETDGEEEPEEDMWGTTTNDTNDSGFGWFGDDSVQDLFGTLDGISDDEDGETDASSLAGSLSQFLRSVGGKDNSIGVHGTDVSDQDLFELAKKLLLANGMSLDDILKGKSYDKGSAYTEPRQAWDMNRITKLLSEGRIKAKQDEEKKEDKASITNASNRSKAINANKKPTASTTK